MKRLIVRLLIILIIVSGAGFGIWRATRPKPVLVEVRLVERSTVERIVANTRAGTVEACRRAKLSPSVGGQIAKLPVSKGDRVKAGNLLLELWNEDLKAEQLLAQSEVESARRRAQAICSKADIARREANRLLRLKESGAVSLERTDRAETEAKALKDECEAANASIRTAEARISVISAQTERTRLIAPFDGIVAEIHGELNEFVTPSPIGVATPPAVDLIDTTCFYVKAPIDEVDAAYLKIDMPVRIRMDAFNDRMFAGKIRRIGAFVLDLEKQARTVDVEASFMDTPLEILAGYSADVEIILETKNNVLRIPTEAILDGKRVFVLKDGIIHEIHIESGISNWDYTEIVSGLSEGEYVVTNPDRKDVRNGVIAAVGKDT